MNRKFDIMNPNDNVLDLKFEVSQNKLSEVYVLCWRKLFANMWKLEKFEASVDNSS